MVAMGRLNADGRFVADQVLAKHDETYMPPEVAEALERASKAGIPLPILKKPRNLPHTDYSLRTPVAGGTRCIRNSDSLH